MKVVLTPSLVDNFMLHPNIGIVSLLWIIDLSALLNYISLRTALRTVRRLWKEEES